MLAGVPAKGKGLEGGKGDKESRVRGHLELGLAPARSFYLDRGKVLAYTRVRLFPELSP